MMFPLTADPSVLGWREAAGHRVPSTGSISRGLVLKQDPDACLKQASQTADMTAHSSLAKPCLTHEGILS